MYQLFRIDAWYTEKLVSVHIKNQNQSEILKTPTKTTTTTTPLTPKPNPQTYIKILAKLLSAENKKPILSLSGERLKNVKFHSSEEDVNAEVGYF